MRRIQHYLIIGASSEVGMAFLRLLEESAEKGLVQDKISVTVHFNAHDEKLRDLEKQCPHLVFDYLKCDLCDEAQIGNMINQLVQRNMPQAFIYLPAAKMKYEKLKKIELEDLDKAYRIQVRALAQISRTLLPAMAKNQFGKTVIMLSECTLGMPPKFTAEYVTVKYAALGLMRALSMEYADKNVNVNGLSPAMMETGFLSEIDSRLIEMNASNCVKKRNATVEEAAKAIAFLVSEGSDYMNGVNLNLSGGNQV